MSEKKSSRLVPRSAFASIKHEPETELVELKIPSSVRIQPKCFDPATYEVEEPIKYLNEVFKKLKL